MGSLHGSSAFQNLAEEAVSPWGKCFGGRGKKARELLETKNGSLGFYSNMAYVVHTSWPKQVTCPSPIDMGQKCVLS